MAANFSIDEYKPLKVVVVGAGISGIYAGIRWVFTSNDYSGVTRTESIYRDAIGSSST